MKGMLVVLQEVKETSQAGECQTAGRLWLANRATLIAAASDSSAFQD